MESFPRWEKSQMEKVTDSPATDLIAYKKLGR